jgi:quinol-cytochrome oxidoreductase complex cytochrome b subunit
MRPLQPHPSWYRRFWYAEHRPLDRLVDRVLLFAIAVLALLAGIPFLDH